MAPTSSRLHCIVRSQSIDVWHIPDPFHPGSGCDSKAFHCEVVNQSSNKDRDHVLEGEHFPAQASSPAAKTQAHDVLTPHVL